MPGPYELYLIRHAVAEERGDEWPDDAKRPLSDDGYFPEAARVPAGSSRRGFFQRETSELCLASSRPRPAL